MADTVAILNTIRATFADSDPEKFNIGSWFDYDTGCGCIIGQSLTMQPMIADTLRVVLDDRGVVEGDAAAGLMSTFGDELWFGAEVPANSIEDQFGGIIGIAPNEVEFLFGCMSYPAELWRGPIGHAEALRRLDEVIARYSAKATTAAHEHVTA